MSKPNGRQKSALEGLAAALTECFEAAAAARHRDGPRDGLAAALTECFEAAVEAGAQRTKGILDEALEAQNRTMNEALEARNRTMHEALEAQNRTLRMIWQQCGGRPDQRLPIDE